MKAPPSLLISYSLSLSPEAYGFLDIGVTMLIISLTCTFRAQGCMVIRSSPPSVSTVLPGFPTTYNDIVK